MSASEEIRFREFLDERDLKFTSERRLILEEAFRIHDHFEADDVELGLRSRGYRVSRASVYRTLPLLVESGLLREVYSAEKHSHYEHVFGHKHHDHLICTSCGRTIEFSDWELEQLQEQICEKHRFDARSHKLEITGICDNCREK
ncbi:MAG TPA: transcriptional repressor [Armatimonadota bacterium]|jgi:Fur family ferric uptake transcriptional regulator